MGNVCLLPDTGIQIQMFSNIPKAVRTGQVRRSFTEWAVGAEPWGREVHDPDRTRSATGDSEPGTQQSTWDRWSDWQAIGYLKK